MDPSTGLSIQLLESMHCAAWPLASLDLVIFFFILSVFNLARPCNGFTRLGQTPHATCRDSNVKFTLLSFSPSSNVSDMQSTCGTTIPLILAALLLLNGVFMGRKALSLCRALITSAISFKNDRCLVGLFETQGWFPIFVVSQGLDSIITT